MQPHMRPVLISTTLEGRDWVSAVVEMRVGKGE